MADKNGYVRTRNYACVVYADSAPSDWRERLASTFIPSFVSPYHDKDLNPTGEPKKSHWHVMIMFDSVKTIEQAKEVFDKIGGVGCERINSLRGYARYLCHLDNPEKQQYLKDDVQCLCGADYLEVIGLVSDKYAAIDEMVQFCEKYNIISFYLLHKYAIAHRSDWKRILADSGAIVMREHLKSKAWSIANGQDNILDPITGEVIF